MYYYYYLYALLNYCTNKIFFISYTYMYKKGRVLSTLYTSILYDYV